MTRLSGPPSMAIDAQGNPILQQANRTLPQPAIHALHRGGRPHVTHRSSIQASETKNRGPGIVLISGRNVDPAASQSLTAAQRAAAEALVTRQINTLSIHPCLPCEL